MEYKCLLEELIKVGFDDVRYDVPEEVLACVVKSVRGELKEKIDDIMTNGYDRKHNQLLEMLSDYSWVE